MDTFCPSKTTGFIVNLKIIVQTQLLTILGRIFENNFKIYFTFKIFLQHEIIKEIQVCLFFVLSPGRQLAF